MYNDYQEAISEESIDYNESLGKLERTNSKNSSNQISKLSLIAHNHMKNPVQTTTSIPKPSRDERSSKQKKKTVDIKDKSKDEKLGMYRERGKKQTRYNSSKLYTNRIEVQSERTQIQGNKDIETIKIQNEYTEIPPLKVTQEPRIIRVQSSEKKPLVKKDSLNQNSSNFSRVQPKNVIEKRQSTQNRSSVMSKIQSRSKDKEKSKDSKLKYGNFEWDDMKNKIGKEKQKKQRLNRLERAKEMLSGKISIIWVFIISGEIDDDLKDRIYDVYQGLLDDSNIVPFVNNAWEIQPFLKIPKVYFKIVTDLNNAEGALKYRINSKVVQYYLYNDDEKNGISRALEFKSWSKKIKGIYSKLERIVDKTEEEIEDNIQLYKYSNAIEATLKGQKFPSFLKLNRKDKTEATLYRGNLYGSVKIKQKEKTKVLDFFMELVEEKYGSVFKQKGNIQDYKRINHKKQIKTISQASEIIKFYTKESFYYQILNSMLRTLKSTEEFKPCILPFNETYHALKVYYKQFLKEEKKILPAMKLYRGAKIRKRDFNKLNRGDYIELFGFISTSKSLKSAQKFTDKDGYMFVIHVPKREITKKFEKYDHGFVDINRYQLADKNFEGEEEVLFNALNIYKIRSIEDSGQNIMIHLEYGAVFDLLEKPQKQLTSEEKSVLTNYQYCTKVMDDVQDQGDVFMLNSEFNQAKDYYKEQLYEDEEDASNILKLANVQKQCGEMDEAEINGKKCLKIFTQKMDLNDRENCLKVFSIHTKNAQINIGKEDYLNADEELTRGIEMLDDDDLLKKAKKIRERGQVKFKKGEIKESQKDLQRSEYMLHSIQKLGQTKKWQLKKWYYCSLFTILCSSSTKQEIQRRRQQQETQIQELQDEIVKMKEQIEDEMVRVNKSMKDVAIYAEDKDKYEYCVKKARAYLINIQQRETTDPHMKAKLKVMQATIQDYLELAESQKLLYDAIALVEKETPFDPTVGEYATILAKLQKQQLQKFTNPSMGMKLSPDKIQVYDLDKNTQIYNRCKLNFEKAINVLLYNHKTKGDPQILNLRNQLGQLELSQQKFQNCEKIIQEIRDSSSNMEHSEVSKSSLLLAKIAFSRGQLKNCFQILEESDYLLQKALIKSQQNPKYRKIYEHSDIFLDIVFTKSKVYTKQLKHDLSIKTLSILEDKIIQKMQGYESHNLLASVYEQFGEVKVMQGEADFIDYFSKAIDMRINQHGQYNVLNAITYCNFSKYLMILKDMKNAEESLTKAVQIFSCMSNENPINWIIYFSNGVMNEQKESFEQAENLFKSSLEMASKKFDSSHITIKKVRLKLAKVLLKKGSVEQSLSYLQNLEENVDQDLQQSRIKIDLEEEVDDEKITLEKLVLTQLKTLIDRDDSQDDKVRISHADRTKYESKYKQLKQNFNIVDLE